jgi:hypothetical protein
MSRAVAPVARIKTRPVAYLCTSQAKLDALIDGSRKESKGTDFILLINDDKRLLGRVLPAYINCMIRHAESSKRARSVQMEMLLFIGGTMNIGKAIAGAGARSASRFVLVSSRKGLASKFIKQYDVKMSKQYRLALDFDISGDVAVTELESEA